jgi:sugar lactone lactonase YvrE
MMPTDVAIDSKGTVFVVDGVNNRIVRFGATDNALSPFAPSMNRPVGIFVDRNDHLWIADSGNHRVLRLSAEGAVDETIEVPNDRGMPAKPTDLLLTPDSSRLYVVDNDNHRLLIRNQKSYEWTVLGASGKSLGQFQYPFMIASDSQQYVYITEAIGARVQAISPANRWAGGISSFGVELGQLYRPKGIAIDGKGRLFVSDSTLQVVQAFDSSGAIEGVLTDEQHRPLRFEHPMGMCFDSAGKLYVVELKANRVAVVSLIEARLR